MGSTEFDPGLKDQGESISNMPPAEILRNVGKPAHGSETSAKTPPAKPGRFT
jgi:hypothetical protein